MRKTHSKLYYVNSAAPALLPIFRTAAQARILAWLLLDPSREQPIASLTAVAGVTQSNVLREVNRLVTAGVLSERRAGNTRLVKAATDSPYYEPLAVILSRSFGPASLVPAELQALEDVEQVVLIGSWAQRFLGVPGPPPRDVDVVVVGDPDRRALRAANRRLEQQLDQPVQLTTISSSDWASGSTGFAETARSRPHVVVLDNRPQAVAKAAPE